MELERRWYGTPMRNLLLALLVGASLGVGIACDVCSAAKEVHSLRCSEGSIDDCIWVNRYHQAGMTCPAVEG